MLHRSFKPAKCKTSLKLAASRIKLLKNKKEIQLKQMKRDLAQLLESGQDQTARIRVEHVVREEKMMAAYDLIGIYCELIIARLPMIESQKNCPIDLKEAVTSLIFASPRCADIPELMDVRKHFTLKYGKEFILAAVELRPDCGVSRMLVEKLSAMAPDGQTKIKILSTIAEEHNIKWDPKSFGEKESKPPDDLLNGPNTFEKATMMHTEPSNFQASHVQVPVSHAQKHDTPSNSYQPGAIPGAANLDSRDAAFYSGVRPSGTGNERMEVRQPHHGDANSFSLGRQNWSMEFKDATSAAQAAAESAEHASMAARAAAELSSMGKISRQYSTESQRSKVHGLRDEGPAKSAASEFPGEHLPNDSVNNSFIERNPVLQRKKTNRNEQDNLSGATESFYWDGHGSTEGSSQPALSRSGKASLDDNTVVNRLQKADRDYLKGSSEEVAVKAEKAEFVSGQLDGLNHENFNNNGEETIQKQSSTVSYHSHSSTFGDDQNFLNFNDQKFQNDAAENPFIGIHQENIHRGTPKTTSFGNPAVVFDEYGSDEDDHRFDIEPRFDEEESKLHFPESGGKSNTHLSTNIDKYAEFPESEAESLDHSQPENFVTAAFDDSDGPNSDSEEEDKSSLSKTLDSGVFLQKQNVYSSDSELTQNKNNGFTGASLAETTKKIGFGVSPASQLTLSPRKSELELEDVARESSFYNPIDESGHQQSRQSSRLSPDALKNNEFLNQSGSENENELHFGMLTGGLRNKGYRIPPYNRGPSHDASFSSKKAAEVNSTLTEQSTASPYAVNFAESEKVDNNSRSRMPVIRSDSDSDDAKEEFPKQTLSSRHQPYDRESGKEINKKSRLRAAPTYFDLDSDDSEEDLPKQTSSNVGRPATGFSRRTKAASSTSEINSYSNVQDGSKASLSSNSAIERKNTRNSYGIEIPHERQPQAVNSDERGSSERPTVAKKTDFKTTPESKLSSSEEKLKSSAKEQSSSPIQVTVASTSIENTKTSTSSGKTLPRENSSKKASHVHPKLPDYDTLAAQLLSLRSNRQ